MGKRLTGKSQSPSLPKPDSVFLNIPYDRKYESLYLAFIAGLVGFGLLPRATLEIPSSERRLDRILELMGACQYSFHDISRVELDTRPPPPTPRFNMSFELGLAVAYRKLVRTKHKWFVFEARQYRQQKSLSDLNGTDLLIHDGRPSGLFRALTNALSKGTSEPTVDELQVIYGDIRRKSVEIRRHYGSLFERRPFIELVLAAEWSRRNRGIPRSLWSQTSGDLLIAIPATKAPAVKSALRAAGIPASIIGHRPRPRAR